MIWPTHETCPLQITSLLQMMSPAQKMLPAQSIWPVHLIMPVQTMSPLQRMSPSQKKSPSWTMLPSQKMWPPAHSPSSWPCYSHVPRQAAPVKGLIYFCQGVLFWVAANPEEIIIGEIILEKRSPPPVCGCAALVLSFFLPPSSREGVTNELTFSY